MKRRRVPGRYWSREIGGNVLRFAQDLARRKSMIAWDRMRHDRNARQTANPTTHLASSSSLDFITSFLPSALHGHLFGTLLALKALMEFSILNVRTFQRIPTFPSPSQHEASGGNSRACRHRPSRGCQGVAIATLAESVKALLEQAVVGARRIASLLIQSNDVLQIRCSDIAFDGIHAT